MNKKLFGWLKALICLLLCINIISGIPLSARAVADDTADADDMTRITISSRTQFLKFCENCRLDSFSSNVYVTLTADIDLSDTDFSGIPTFGGIFDGDGHRISGFSITRDGSIQGFFRYLREGAVVRNLHISGEIAPGGSHRYVGGFAGSNSGTVANCSFSGRVSGSQVVGGIAGRNELTGIIENCTVSGDIHGDHFIGGIAGDNVGVVRGCENSAEINTVLEHNGVDLDDITLDSLTSSEAAIVTTDIGGIAGTSSGVIRDCTNAGNIGYQHIGYNVGGIAGSQVGYIVSCKNTGTIHARKEAGGIVGQMEPSTVLSYQADTMQILEGQLGTLSSLVDNTASSVQGTAGELGNQMTVLQGHVNDAQDALDQLMPDSPDAEQPDPDSTQAALNSLNGSLNAISSVIGSMSQTSEESLNALTGNMSAISSQMGAIGSTIASSSENVGGTVIDASDNDTESDISSKVEGCTNRGSIQADLNAGGIAGAVAIENDLDPEDDLQIFGDSSLKYTCEARAVVTGCDNYGVVTVKRQNAGGIAGWMSLGLLKNCTNSGAIEASGAKYVGGIAGQSNGYIRQCSAKCTLSGSVCIGGVAGTGNIVTDCRTKISVEDGSEQTGAVLGYSEDIFSRSEDEEQPIRGNYYIVADEDIGGIDGISYDSAAQKLTEEEFYSLDGLDRIFRTVTVRFIYEDGSERTAVIGQGGALSISDIPLAPEKEGHTGYWEGFDEADISCIEFDLTFRLVYVPYDTAIRSEATRDNGLPILLIQGEFSDSYGLTLSLSELTPVTSEEQTVVECWEFTLPQSSADTKLRYHLPEGSTAEGSTVSVMDSSGTWSEREYQISGSYLVFPVESGDQAFALIHTPEDYRVEIIAGASALGVIVIMAIITAIVRKRKSKA